jgi:hypothetical protein
MIEKLKAHEWKQTNFYTINEEALKAKIAPSEEEEEEELSPIESVKSAIALLEKHSKHPATKGIVQNIINGAKANASESELEEIQRLEDEAFEF